MKPIKVTVQEPVSSYSKLHPYHVNISNVNVSLNTEEAYKLMGELADALWENNDLTYYFYKIFKDLSYDRLRDLKKTKREVK